MDNNINKIVNDYINGQPFDENFLEKLENNKKFMMAVINKSCDYRLYNLCSEKLKTNKEFVKFLIFKFKDNLDFICEVANYLIKNNENNLDRIEIIIIMCKLIESDNERKIHYLLCAESIYQYERIQIEYIRNNSSEYDVNVIGMGFYLLFDKYNDNEEVLYFFADKMLRSLIDEKTIDLEKILHDQFDSPEEIDNLRINDYLLNIVSTYDSMLSSYISIHIDLLTNLRKTISHIQKRWNYYLDYQESKRFLKMFDAVHNYLTNEEYGLLDETTLIYYVGKQLGVSNQISKHDTIRYLKFDKLIDDIDEGYVRDILEVSFQDRIILKNVKKIMSDILLDKNNENDIPNAKIKYINFCKK